MFSEMTPYLDPTNPEGVRFVKAYGSKVRVEVWSVVGKRWLPARLHAVDYEKYLSTVELLKAVKARKAKASREADAPPKE